MAIHTSMVIRHLVGLAASDPLVIAGDFNFNPESECYKIVAEGEMFGGRVRGLFGYVDTVQYRKGENRESFWFFCFQMIFGESTWRAFHSSRVSPLFFGMAGNMYN